MKEIKNKIHITLLITFALIVSIEYTAIAADKILTTDHFIISYNLKDHYFALSLGDNLESFHGVIGSFLDYDPLDKLNIIIQDTGAEELINNNIISRNQIIISYTDFDMIKRNLSDIIFKKYLYEIMNDGKVTSIIDESFIKALIQYPLASRQFIGLKVSDLVNQVGISSVDFKNIQNYSTDKQQIIYTALIDFIITDYGKKNLIQSLKDAHYYNDFYKSISKITGSPITIVSEQFNRYLQKRKSDFYDRSANTKKRLHLEDEYNDIALSISVNGKSAVLQKNNDKFRLLIQNGQSENLIILNQTQSGSSFNGIIFLSDDQLAVIEILQSGSAIHIYDMNNNKFIIKKTLPFLFITDVNTRNNESIIFSAGCGTSSDIYTLNFKTGDLCSLGGTGWNCYPLVTKEKIYYVKKTNGYSIIELDTYTNITRTLFSTDQRILNLNKANEQLLVFSMEINGLENIFTLDLPSCNLHRITNDTNSYLSPQVHGDKLYYFLYYQSRYHLFYDDYKSLN